MVSPDAIEIQAPESSFQTAMIVAGLPDGKLGNNRTRRHVYASPVLSEDLRPEALQSGYYREGLSHVIDYLPVIRLQILCQEKGLW